MLHRSTTASGEAVYEIRSDGWALRLSAREVCQLACSIETLFRDGRQELIDDVCHESEAALQRPEGSRERVVSRREMVRSVQRN